MSGWRELEREVLVATPHLQVIRELVATPTRPDGVDWVVVRRKQAAVIAPRTPEGNYLLVRQERVPVRAEFWEFPAGQVDGEPTPEAIRAAAHRELGEETGCRAEGEMIALGSYYSSVGFTDEQAHLFLATNVVAGSEVHAPDDGEAIVACRAFSPEELRDWIARGEIRDANTLSLFARLVATGNF